MSSLPMVAKKSVKSKIKFGFDLRLEGNCECAYAVGLAARKLGITIPEQITVEELKAQVEAQADQMPIQDREGITIIDMLKRYEFVGETTPDLVFLLHLDEYSRVGK